MSIILNTRLEKNFLKGKKVLNVDNCEFYSKSRKDKIFIKKNEFFWKRIVEKKNFSKNIKKLRIKLFPILCKKLNKIHNVNFSNKTWNVIINPWLNNYLENMYFRWKQIKKIIKKNKKIETVYLKNVKPVTFFDNLDYNNYVYSNDYYNQFILQRYWQYFKNKKIKIIEKNKYFKNNLSYPFLKKKNIKGIFVNFFDKILCYIFKNQKYFIELNIGLFNYLKLCFNLKIFPTKGSYWFGNEKTIYFFNKKINNDTSLRENFKFFSTNSKNFINFLDLFLKKDIPQAYVEKFDEILKYVKFIPLNPKIIFSDTLYTNTTLFKFWLAIKMENKQIKFICTDHGGTFGNGLKSIKYEKEISDLYISWIKSKNKIKKHLPILHLNNFKYKRPKKINKIMFIAHDGPKYPKYFNLGPISDEFFQQQEINKKLFLSLKEEIFRNMLIRNYPIKNLDWWIKKRMNAIFTKEQFVTNDKLYKILLKNVKLKICTSPKSTFLQCIKSGPTILFFKKNFYLENKKNQKMLDCLKNAKIFFDNPVALAEHLNKNWTSLEDWWNLKKTKKTINLFNDIFCYTSDNSVDQWSNFLSKIKI